MNSLGRIVATRFNERRFAHVGIRNTN
jgi:hypothetical protein